MSYISFVEQQVLKNAVVNKLNSNIFDIFQLRVFVFPFLHNPRITMSF